MKDKEGGRVCVSEREGGSERERERERVNMIIVLK